LAAHFSAIRWNLPGAGNVLFSDFTILNGPLNTQDLVSFDCDGSSVTGLVDVAGDPGPYVVLLDGVPVGGTVTSRWTQTFCASNLNLQAVDNGTVSSAIPLGSFPPGTTMADVDVAVAFSTDHTWLSDLSISLETNACPVGNGDAGCGGALLLDGDGGSGGVSAGDNAGGPCPGGSVFADAAFDDAGVAVPAGYVCNPMTGGPAVQPAITNALASFNGLDPDGLSLFLNLADVFNGDSGTLGSWCLTIEFERVTVPFTIPPSSAGGSVLTVSNLTTGSSSSQLIGLPLPSVVAVSPSQHAVGVDPNASLVIDFAPGSDPAALARATVEAHSIFGTLSGQISIARTTLTFNPDRALFAGEEVKVTVTDTNGIGGACAFQWAFTAGPVGGSCFAGFREDTLASAGRLGACSMANPWGQPKAGSTPKWVTHSSPESAEERGATLVPGIITALQSGRFRGTFATTAISFCADLLSTQPTGHLAR